MLVLQSAHATGWTINLILKFVETIGFLWLDCFNIKCLAAVRERHTIRWRERKTEEKRRRARRQKKN